MKGLAAQTAPDKEIKGRIAHQLDSIEKNVHRGNKSLNVGFDEAAWKVYFQKSDVIEKIANAIEANHQPKLKQTAKTNQTHSKPQEKSPKLTDTATVGMLMRTHYALVFGADIKVREAHHSEQYCSMLAQLLEHK
jgi:hypothetical protein